MQRPDPFWYFKIAGWLGEDRGQQHFARHAAALRERIIDCFWEKGRGFHHTLRAVRPGFEKYGPGWGEPSYNPLVDGPPSGPSRHSTACAVFADLADASRRAVMLEHGFEATGQPHVLTPMFLYYEQEARARLGDPAGALTRMRDWLANINHYRIEKT